tara:strand:- start:3607 stop:5196 length:1590 start_codon:yes stop_codon:yes gene_type:complete
MKNYPLDIWSAKKEGINKSLEEYFIPASINELSNIFSDVELLYSDCINDADTEIKEILLVLYKYSALYISEILQFHKLYTKVKQFDLLPICSQKTLSYYSNLNNKSVSYISKPKFYSLSTKIKARAVGLKNEINSFGLFTTALNQVSDINYLAIEWRDQKEYFEKYAESNLKRIKIIPWQWFMPDRNLNFYKSVNIKYITEMYKEGLISIVKKYDITINENLINMIVHKLNESVSYINSHIIYIEKLLKGYKRSKILCQGLGSLSVRTLCVAAKRNNQEVVGFPHGNTVGIDKSSSNQLLFHMVDSFIVPTEPSIKLYKRFHKKYLTKYGLKIKLQIVPSNIYNNILTSTRNISIKNNINAAMVIEVPLHRFIFQNNNCMYYMYHLSFCIRIANSIRKTKVESILKRHPDRLDESKDVYEPYFDRVIVDSFEYTYQQCDIVIFTTLRSTAFGFCLLTNKPIIIFEHLLNNIWKEPGDLLRNRCRVVPSYVNENGQVEFDEAKFIHFLNEKPVEPNDEFINKYMVNNIIN